MEVLFDSKLHGEILGSMKSVNTSVCATLEGESLLKVYALTDVMPQTQVNEHIFDDFKEKGPSSYFKQEHYNEVLMATGKVHGITLVHAPHWGKWMDSTGTLRETGSPLMYVNQTERILEMLDQFSKRFLVKLRNGTFWQNTRWGPPSIELDAQGCTSARCLGYIMNPRWYTTSGAWVDSSAEYWVNEMLRSFHEGSMMREDFAREIV